MQLMFEIIGMAIINKIGLSISLNLPQFSYSIDIGRQNHFIEQSNECSYENRHEPAPMDHGCK
jgi:hypothetical protein